VFWPGENPLRILKYGVTDGEKVLYRAYSSAEEAGEEVGVSGLKAYQICGIATPMADTFPDQIKTFSNGHDLVEVAPFVRFVQPAPSVNNTAKALAVYEHATDGSHLGNLQVAFPGSPVRLRQDTVYVVTPRLKLALNNAQVSSAASALDGANSMALYTHDYRPVYGHEEQIQFGSNQAARLPAGLGVATPFLRVPNPGKRRVGLTFMANVANVVADVVAVYDPPAGAAVFFPVEQTVIAAQPLAVVGQGTADAIPIEWRVALTAIGPALPTFAVVSLSFEDL
jgi:hypothetical protein